MGGPAGLWRPAGGYGDEQGDGDQQGYGVIRGYAEQGHPDSGPTRTEGLRLNLLCRQGPT